MKKHIGMLMLGLAFAGLSLVGCSNCVTCTNCPYQDDYEICKKDLGGNKLIYDVAVSSAELSGCTCN